MMDAIALSRLLQLASPLLPVGAYSYSQGLEWAIEEGTVHDEASTQRWIGDVLEYSMASFELPILWQLCEAWQANEEVRIQALNQMFSAGRETAEFHAETLQMGYSLSRLLEALDQGKTPQAGRLKEIVPASFPAVYACAVAIWHIPVTAALQAYVWSLLENQVGVAMKTIPLGQMAGQRVLFALGGKLPDLLLAAGMRRMDELSNFVPGLSLAGCRHETQYSRMFRS